MWECMCIGSRSHREILNRLPAGLRSLLEIPTAKGQEGARGIPASAAGSQSLGCLPNGTALSVAGQASASTQEQSLSRGVPRGVLQSCPEPCMLCPVTPPHPAELRLWQCHCFPLMHSIHLPYAALGEPGPVVPAVLRAVPARHADCCVRA